LAVSESMERLIIHEEFQKEMRCQAAPMLPSNILYLTMILWAKSSRFRTHWPSSQCKLHHRCKDEFLASHTPFPLPPPKAAPLH
jgi:hypothetical protein